MDPTTSASVEHFFSRLAERRYRENDLSDVTWAMCNAMRDFGSALANFADPSIPFGATVEVDREVDLGQGCRVDFACRSESGAVFIEVKIYDQNYHIEPYADQVDRQQGARLVLLTNHALASEHQEAAKRRGWAIRKWQDFAEHVKGLFPEHPLVAAYLNYLRGVCNMIEWRPVRLDPASLYSLVPLHALLDEAIGAASHDPFSYERYRVQREHGSGYLGACFQLDYRQGDVHRQAWGFYGLDFSKPGSAELQVWLYRDWNDDLLRVPLMNGMAGSMRVRSDDHGVGIVASDDVLRKFFHLSLEEQRVESAQLFRELMGPIEAHIAGYSHTLWVRRQ